MRIIASLGLAAALAVTSGAFTPSYAQSERRDRLVDRQQNQSIRDLRRRVRALTRDVVQLENADRLQAIILEQLQDDVATLQGAIDSKMDAITALEEDVARLEEAVANHVPDERLEEALARLTALEADKAALEAQVAANTADLSMVQTDIDTVQADIDMLKLQIGFDPTELQALIGENAAAIATLEDEVDQLFAAQANPALADQSCPAGQVVTGVLNDQLTCSTLSGSGAPAVTTVFVNNRVDRAADIGGGALAVVGCPADFLVVDCGYRVSPVVPSILADLGPTSDNGCIASLVETGIEAFAYSLTVTAVCRRFD